MRNLDQDQLTYVKNRTFVKRLAAMTKPLHYQVAEHLFLISPSTLTGKWKLVDQIDQPSRTIDDDDQIEILLKKNAEFQAVINANQALQNKQLKDWLASKEIQYVLLKAEEALQSQLTLSKIEKKRIEQMKQVEAALQVQKRNSDLARFGFSDLDSTAGAAPAAQSSAASSASVPQSNNRAPVSASAVVQPPVIQSNSVSLRLAGYNAYSFELKNNSLTMEYKAGLRTHKIKSTAENILCRFKEHYPRQTELASFFSRDALAKASDQRPWYQRWFIKVSQQASVEQQVTYLLNHAKKNPKSNTAKALMAVLDDKVSQIKSDEVIKAAQFTPEEKEAFLAQYRKPAENVTASKDITDIDELIKKWEAESSYTFGTNRSGEYNLIKKSELLEIEEEKQRDLISKQFETGVSMIQQPQIVAEPRKPDSPVSFVSGSSTSGGALPAAAESEPVSPISFQWRPRSDSQNSAVSALISSARSGSFPPSPDGSSRRATPADVVEMSRSNRREMLANLEKVFEPLWNSLSAEVVTKMQKNGAHTLIFNADHSNEAVQNVKIIYDIFTAVRSTLSELTKVTDDQVAGVLKTLETFVKLHIPSDDEQLSIAIRSQLPLVKADWVAKMERRLNDASTPSNAIINIFNS